MRDIITSMRNAAKVTYKKKSPVAEALCFAMVPPAGCPRLRYAKALDLARLRRLGPLATNAPRLLYARALPGSNPAARIA